VVSSLAAFCADFGFVLLLVVEILYLSFYQIICHNLGFTRAETLLFLEATDYNSYYYNVCKSTGRYILVSFNTFYPSKLKNCTWIV